MGLRTICEKGDLCTMPGGWEMATEEGVKGKMAPVQGSARQEKVGQAHVERERRKTGLIRKISE